MKGIMKAAVFKGIGHITVEERPIPECPEDGLLIKVYAALRDLRERCKKLP